MYQREKKQTHSVSLAFDRDALECFWKVNFGLIGNKVRVDFFLPVLRRWVVCRVNRFQPSKVRELLTLPDVFHHFTCVCSPPSRMLCSLLIPPLYRQRGSTTTPSVARKVAAAAKFQSSLTIWLAISARHLFLFSQKTFLASENWQFPQRCWLKEDDDYQTVIHLPDIFSWVGGNLRSIIRNLGGKKQKQPKSREAAIALHAVFAVPLVRNPTPYSRCNFIVYCLVEVFNSFIFFFSHSILSSPGFLRLEKRKPVGQRDNMICIGLTGCFNDQLMRETFQQQPLRFLLTLQFYEKRRRDGFSWG